MTMLDEQPASRPILARLFLSPGERRLRVGWRITGQMLLFLVALFAFTLPFSLLLLLPPTWFAPLVGDSAQGLLLLVGLPAQVLAGLVSVVLARRFLDRRTLVNLGLARGRRAVQDLIAGMGFPGLMLGFIFAVQWALGWLQVEGFSWQSQPTGQVLGPLVFLFLAFVGVGIYEELIFRGYWLQNLAESVGWTWAALLSSAGFALSHFNNPGISPTALAGLLLAGLFFAYSYRQAGNLWLPIGLHIGWNFFEGPILGFQVSGLEAFRLIEQHVQGPVLWTGGAFGPEAGLLLLPALVLGTFLVTAYTRGRRT